MQITGLAIQLAEKNLIPDCVIRAGIRHLSKVRLDQISAANCESAIKVETDFINAMNQSPIALVPELANAQHYEVPARFFQLCLGKHRKYSSCQIPERWMKPRQTPYSSPVSMQRWLMASRFLSWAAAGVH